MPKIAVLASGSGSILASIIEHALPVSLVLADRKCKALEIAETAGIPTELVDRRDFGWQGKGSQWDRAGFTYTVAVVLNSYGIELAPMAGFMTVLDSSIFTDFGGNILNIHPALLPFFKGDNAVGDALAAYKRHDIPHTGSTVHIATERLDDERWIIRQVVVPIFADDSEEVLHERIKVEERILYPAVLRDILDGVINLSEIKEQS